MTVPEENTTPAAPTPRKRPATFASVSDAGLRLQTIRLKSLVCMVSPEASPDSPTTAEADPKGELQPDSAPDRFTSLVSWSLNFLDCQRPPITITGKHELVFTTQKPMEKHSQEYYSEVNSVILAFPYIRHVIDDMSMKCLGRSVVILPLDVPKFTARLTAEKLKAAENVKASGDPDEPSSPG